MTPIGTRSGTSLVGCTDMGRIVIDTSALFAVLREDDSFHEAALATYTFHAAGESEFITTSYALVEAVALAHRRRGFDEARRLIDFAEREINVVWMTAESHAAMLEQYVNAQGRSLSLVDWSLVLLAQDAGAYLFTFDSRMARQSVAVLPII